MILSNQRIYNYVKAEREIVMEKIYVVLLLSILFIVFLILDYCLFHPIVHELGHYLGIKKFKDDGLIFIKCKIISSRKYIKIGPYVISKGIGSLTMSKTDFQNFSSEQIQTITWMGIGFGITYHLCLIIIFILLGKCSTVYFFTIACGVVFYTLIELYFIGKYFVVLVRNKVLKRPIIIEQNNWSDFNILLDPCEFKNYMKNNGEYNYKQLTDKIGYEE